MNIGVPPVSFELGARYRAQLQITGGKTGYSGRCELLFPK
jgi:hypothetical protein